MGENFLQDDDARTWTASGDVQINFVVVFGTEEANTRRISFRGWFVCELVHSSLSLI
jgi:hypothetical protein